MCQLIRMFFVARFPFSRASRTGRLMGVAAPMFPGVPRCASGQASGSSTLTGPNDVDNEDDNDNRNENNHSGRHTRPSATCLPETFSYSLKPETRLPAGRPEIFFLLPTTFFMLPSARNS